MKKQAVYHLPGLFEFYEFYRHFLPLFYEHREYFYEWCEIGSIYGAPADCLWGGGRFGFGENDAQEVVSHKALGDICSDHMCSSPDAAEGYVFSKAKKNPGFIGIEDIKNVYLPMGFSNFKIEGRSLGSALVLEFLLYYMTRPEYQLEVREKIYLDHSLDLF